MQTITATELARHTREVLDRVSAGGMAISVERNQVVIATIAPAERTLTASQALSGLPEPLLTAEQATDWLEASRQGFGEELRDPWA